MKLLLPFMPIKYRIAVERVGVIQNTDILFAQIDSLPIAPPAAAANAWSMLRLGSLPPKANAPKSAVLDQARNRRRGTPSFWLRGCIATRGLCNSVIGSSFERAANTERTGLQNELPIFVAWFPSALIVGML